jgi:iron complex outermembrane recepter protein
MVYKFIKKITLLFLLIIILQFFLFSENHTPKLQEEFLILKEYLNIEIITAGRKLQKISEAPAAMSVITAEDIKQSGATQVGEALRMVVGLHLGYTNHNSMIAGGIRGFHKLPTNKIVFLIDGISYSYEHYEIPMMNMLPVSLNEIERIEVLRGPGSSLYGANAMFGVINIITKKTEDTKGSLFSVTGGEHKTLSTNYMYGGQVNKNINFRVTAEFDRKDNRDYIAFQLEPEYKKILFNTKIDYEINDNSKLSFSGSYVNPKHIDILLESTGPVDISGAVGYRFNLFYTLKEPNIKIQTYYKNHKRSQGWSLGKKVYDFRLGSKGVALQHIWEPFENDAVVWGVNFDQKYSDCSITGGKKTHNLPGIFLDNTFNINDNINLNSGIRLDRHPNTDNTVSHRLSLQYNPDRKNHFRATWGSSFRNPDFIENYYSRYTQIGSDTYLHIYGQKNNKPEKASTIELAYTGQFTEKFIFESNIFYSEIKDFIYFTASGNPYNDTNIGGLIIPYPFMNIGDAKQFGTELEIKYQFSDYFNGIINYTYIDQKEKESIVKQLLIMTPQKMANAQIRGNLIKMTLLLICFVILIQIILLLYFTA